MNDKPFEVGDFVTISDPNFNSIIIPEGREVIVTRMHYNPVSNRWHCNVVTDTGQQVSGVFCYRFRKIGVISNEERMRIRKEQLANG